MSENYKSKRRSQRSNKSGNRNDRRSFDKRNDDRQFESKGKKGNCGGNDPSWYTVPGQLTKDVASLSFNNASGIPYQMDPGDSNTKLVTPGIMSIYMGMCPGVGSAASSALNVAAKNLYAYVRHQNSGHTNYDSPDLMMYILAMDSAFAYYAWMARIYGMMRVYDQRNRYLGENMVKACGVNPSTIDLASFRAYINQYAVKLGAFNVPSSMSLYKRHSWMFSNVYADEDDIKGQYYMYQPAYVYYYDDVKGELVAQNLCCKATPNVTDSIEVNDGMTMTSIMNIGDIIIQHLAGSEDINIMSGDILKAYGGDVFKLSLIDENFAIVPIFSEEVLTQIHNTTFIGGHMHNGISGSNSAFDCFKVRQMGNPGYGYLMFQLSTDEGGGSIGCNKFLDFWKADITPEDVMVATRNMVFSYYDEIGKKYDLQTCGTEVPFFAAIYTNDPANPTVLTRITIGWSDELSTTVTGLTNLFKRVSKLSYFNEHPIIVKGTYDANSKFTLDKETVIGELSNFTIVNFDDIRKMHDTALLSMLAVPLLGNVART